MKKIQDYLLILFIIIQEIFGIMFLFDHIESSVIGIFLIILGGLVSFLLIKKRFVDYILFFYALGFIFFGLILCTDEFNSYEKSPFFFVPGIFIFFILWKDNFFTKNPIN
jgi:hypothetical protein